MFFKRDLSSMVCFVLLMFNYSACLVVNPFESI